jgi:hypothetical protein
MKTQGASPPTHSVSTLWKVEDRWQVYHEKIASSRIVEKRSSSIKKKASRERLVIVTWINSNQIPES